MTCRARRLPAAVNGLRLAAVALLAALAATALAACTVVTSEALNEISRAREEPNGVYYSLPMGLVDFDLYVHANSAEFRVELGKERYVADPGQRYLMRYKPRPNYSDTVEIAVNSRSLIQKVHTTTTDKTGDIVVELANAFTRLAPTRFQSSASTAGFDRLATVTIDPTDPVRLQAAVRELNARAKTFAASFMDARCRTHRANETTCDLYARYLKPGHALIVIKAEPPAPIGPAAPADCTQGLCYRINEPWLIVTSVAGVRSATIVQLPNRAPLVEIEISRALFVEKVHEIDFDQNGFLKQVHIKKPSELLAVTKAPISVIEAIGKAFPVRLTIQQKQNDLAERQLAEIEARRSLIEARQPKGIAKAAGEHN